MLDRVRSKLKQMNHFFYRLCMLCIPGVLAAQDTLHVQEYLHTEPVSISKHSLEKASAWELMENTHYVIENPTLGDPFTNTKGKTSSWKKKNAGEKNNFSLQKNGDYGLQYTAFYIENDDFVRCKLLLWSNQLYQLYVDGNSKPLISQKRSYKDEMHLEEKFIDLSPGKHTIHIKHLYEDKYDNGRVKVAFALKKEYDKNAIRLSLSPKRNLALLDLMELRKIDDFGMSYDGAYYMRRTKKPIPNSDESEYISEWFRSSDQKKVMSLTNKKYSQLQWVPKKHAFSYVLTQDGKKSLIVYNLDTATEEKFINRIPKLNSYQWAHNGKFVVFSSSEKAPSIKNKTLHLVEDLDHRFRNKTGQSLLHIANYKDRNIRKLTYGKFTTHLQDISYSGEKLIYSKSELRENERPFHYTSYWEMDIKTGNTDSLFAIGWGGNANYSPKDNAILVTAGPDAFNGIGRDLPNNQLANAYDKQAYIYTIKDKKVRSISKHFDPSIQQIHWNPYDNYIYMTVHEKDFENIYRYDVKKDSYSQISIPETAVKSLYFGSHSSKAYYTAESAQSPIKLYELNLKKLQSKLNYDPNSDLYKKVAHGAMKDWNFTNKSGQAILGRVYYPPNFDANKNYPALVYYYGGTMPTSRNYSGRYPKNLYAAHGYVVYVLQPTGAIGFGQEFSAAHANNWGESNAGDILEALPKFLEAHPFVDKEKVGCIGASYGGFMTMSLLTQTDEFSAAVAHAGISSISSYWGEGNWGYTYSAQASAESYPWNNPELYTKNSPLFNADKINTPLLLTHGTVDNNVPIGESIQMYTALKLLGKDVEFLRVKNENHHILKYKNFILWQESIIAYFDKKLKGNSRWWNHLYPSQK